MHPLLTGDGERGSAVNVQAAILYPLILITFMTVLQIGLYFYGRDLALSAARSGVDTGRVYGGNAAAQDHATGFLTRTASGVLSAPSASASADGRTITVTVQATVTTLVPGLTLTVRQSSTGALEQVTR